MRALLPYAALTAAALAASTAGAAKVESVDVAHEGGLYRVVSDLTIDAPLPAVYATLADYDQFERVSSVFEDSRYLSRDANGEGIVYARMHDCVLFFCRSIERVETLTLDPPREILTVVIPERSDMRSGETRWTFRDNGEGTRIRHEMTMEPDFWVPPIIGPFILKRYLKKGSAAAAERLERIAREAAAADAGAAP